MTNTRKAFAGELYVLIGGVENGDLDLIERHVGRRFRAEWSVPKSVQPGDRALIYIRRPHGSFVASADIASTARKGRKGEWAYLATIENLQSVASSVTLADLKEHFPQWRWLNYPRSFCHVPKDVARDLWRLCHRLSRQQPGLPTVSEYMEGFRSIRPSISPIQFGMLEAHYLAPGHIATASEIALAAGYDGANTTNSQYGRLGTKLREALGRPLRDNEQQSYILASFEPPDDVWPHWRWHMHRPVAAALRRLGWFGDPSRDGEATDTYASLMPSATENRLVRQLRTHRSRERSLARAKIAAARAADPAGRLRCEVPGCGFDFESTYGPIGEGFAEVHHLTPLADVEGPIVTTLSDLAVVCANCHRMIHKGNACRPLGELLAHLKKGGT